MEDTDNNEKQIENKTNRADAIRYSAIFLSGCIILLLIYLIKFWPSKIGITPDSNVISAIHWSYYTLALIGSLFYIMVLFRNPIGSFNIGRALSDAVSRVAQAIIYTIIILNIYGSVIKIDAHTNITVDGAIVSLLIGMYVKLFQNTITGIAKKINVVISPEARDISKELVLYEKIKEEHDLIFEELVKKYAPKLAKQKININDLIEQMENNTETLKNIRKYINERELEKAKGSMLDIDTRIKKIKLRLIYLENSILSKSPQI